MTATGSAPARAWRLPARQVRAVFDLDVGRNLRGRRALPLALLGLAPVALFALVRAVVYVRANPVMVAEAERMFATAFHEFVVRWCLFFACAAVFLDLFRGEMADRTLHYYFLAPVRREGVVVGKYLAGLASTVLVLGGSTALAYLLALSTAPPGRAIAHLTRGPGLAHLAAYLAMVALACLAYGALFLLIGLAFRNPILPALFVLVWEYINFLLPPALKHVSVSYYLYGLAPVPVTEGPVAIVAEPVSAPAAVASLCVLTFALVALAAWRARGMEIRYGAD
jgi:ABC-type transport system involved in multi-copper enzyme maturation permease subunit